MLRKSVLALVMVLSTGAAGVMTSGVGQAFPLAAPLTEAANTAMGIDLAAYRRKVVRHGMQHHSAMHHRYRTNHRYGHRWVYSSRFGHRYRHRYGHYIYYYGGWWYPRPWWSVSVGVYPRYYGCRKVVRWYHHRKVIRRVC